MTVRAVRAVLLSHGWEGDAAETAAAGLEPWTHELTGLVPEQVEGLLRTAPRFGLDLTTGPDWALLTGPRARFASFARSWSLPPELLGLVVPIGSALPSDPAPFWRDGTVVHDLAHPVVLSPRAEGGFPPAGGDEPSRGGVIVRGDSAESAIDAIARRLDDLITAGTDPETIALDPGWSPPLARFRRFGRPIIHTGNDPVRAALARLAGAQVFMTSNPVEIRRALDLAEQS